MGFCLLPSLSSSMIIPAFANTSVVVYIGQPNLIANATASDVRESSSTTFSPPLQNTFE